jgi:hypothetical protein
MTRPAAITFDEEASGVPRELFEWRIVALVMRGKFTMADAAWALKVSRATVLRRCRSLNIDPKASRAAFLARLKARIKREQARREKANSTIVLRAIQ